MNYIFVHLLDYKVFQSSLMHGINMNKPIYVPLLRRQIKFYTHQ